MKIYSVMNVLIIKFHHSNSFLQTVILQIEEDITEYEVEFIDGKRKDDQEFRIK